MSPMTSALISYWHQLPAESHAARAQALMATIEEVRAGRRPASALATFALADADADIVRTATLSYVQSPAAGATAATDTLEWIRRGLALNRGAVFAALLELGDTALNERLAGLRLGLAAQEVAVLCRLLPASPHAAAMDFLAEWRELLEGSAEPALRSQLEILREARAALDLGVPHREAA